MSSPDGIGKVIFTEEQIQQQIKQMADQINQDYQGMELIIICILKGSLYFTADLTRLLTIPLNVDFLSIGVSKEAGGNPGVVRITKDLDLSLTGRHVLLVEDVIGTGLTLGYICQHLESGKPASLKICTLLDNPAERLINMPIAYRGFLMPDVFVVGYGLDYQEKYRNLPYIAEFRPNNFHK
ncbi:hypoxanthine phosphoribosyltransferase [Dehalobacterium formicoaceticum]|uniref:Hypoxanthine phosphoribosyltransferase n=1 Tax=Dehalobacterium formicoaceticum TaxID=51515 RepID=A0ABT1Y3P1_9FIRM|nr:hypoxanthine phosphoribosyltransferase [Dehalobacterium formicoaceticum]MCR6545490.1 hypoxanthine phosphoribosyltransferase [Dehalobacterium formicoaceticum]